jgi:drug/metabolite transporter (DMT)-like permease
LQPFYKAAFLTIAGVFMFTCVDIFIKFLSPVLPVGQVLIAFGTGTAGMFWLMASRTRQPILDKRYFHRATIFRCISEMVGGLALVVALSNSALSTVTAIMQTAPLVLTIMAAVFLKEVIGVSRIAAIIFGFLGVLIIIRPSAGELDIYAVCALVGVIGLAGRDFSARLLPDDVSVIGLSFYGSLFVILSGLLLMIVTGGWVFPNSKEIFYCVAMAACGGVGLWCMSTSIRLADVSAVSPYRYTRIIFGMVTGVIIFDEKIDVLTIFGALIIVGAGLYGWSRERIHSV